MTDTLRHRTAIASWVLGVVVVVVTVWNLVDLTRADPSDAPAPPAASDNAAGPVPTPAPERSVVASTPPPPGPVERCSEYYLHRRFGAEMTIADCRENYALLVVPAGLTGLYRWSGQRWEFYADPYDGRCREDLMAEGVPQLLVRDFPPCAPPPTARPEETDEVDSPSVPTPDGRFEVRGPLGVGTPGGGGVGAPDRGGAQGPEGEMAPVPEGPPQDGRP